MAVRSAEAAGLREVYLIGNAELFRSPARGTDRLIPVHAVADAAALVRRAREEGYQLVAVQQTPDSVPYHTAVYPPRPLFVMGAEDRGVPPALRAAADLVVEIPLFGGIDSLNVAAAATTVLFHWRCHLGRPQRGAAS
ncbi:MAG: TrmH family RNA methyltransferase [bacterium]